MQSLKGMNKRQSSKPFLPENIEEVRKSIEQTERIDIAFEGRCSDSQFPFRRPRRKGS